MAGPFAHNLLTPAYCKWMRDGEEAALKGGGTCTKPIKVAK